VDIGRWLAVTCKMSGEVGMLDLDIHLLWS
jgi:hypothetical protein